MSAREKGMVVLARRCFSCAGGQNAWRWRQRDAVAALRAGTTEQDLRVTHVHACESAVRQVFLLEFQ